jgi:hypothetical protein
VRIPPNLAELRDQYHEMFYRGQDWFAREPFMRIMASEPPVRGPLQIVKRGRIPRLCDTLPRAVDVALIYLSNPTDPAFQDYVWTGDFDSHGQRVFVGGCANGKGFEIHRFLHITDRWQTPALP